MKKIKKIVLWAVGLYFGLSVLFSVIITIFPINNFTTFLLEHRNFLTVVEVVRSTPSVEENGNAGYDTKGFYITYNKPHETTETVTSLVIYNPLTNYYDDILFIIDSGEIR